ncbi:MAG: hypothetical protein HQ518_30275 [Rhodopirellula sp.]|nr:hypothetical protein [Rhodopirellula sp.]
MSESFSSDELASNGFRVVRDLHARRLGKLADEAGRENDLDEIGVQDVEKWLDREGTAFACLWEFLRELLGDPCNALVPVDVLLGRLHDEVTAILIGQTPEADVIENPVLREIRRIEEITVRKQSETLFNMVPSFRPTEYVEEEFRGRSSAEKSNELKKRFDACSNCFRKAATQVLELEL